MKPTNDKSNYIITVHDNLLADLYSLTSDNIYYKKIDNEQYLVNETKGRGYKIGLQYKIPNEMLIKNNMIMDYNDLDEEEKNSILEKLKQNLFFSNIEIFITNILLDDYLTKNINYSISFKKIENYYRKKSISNKYQVSELNYKHYIRTINNLANKEIFLITDSNFRNSKYSVNNLNLKQSFLTLLDSYNVGKNNISFCYSFDKFGKVLKSSRRYSNFVPSVSYRCRLNQCMLHSVYYFIGKEVFFRKGLLSKSHNIEYSFTLDVNNLMSKIHYDTRNNNVEGLSVLSKLEGFKSQPNKNRTSRMFYKYILLALKQLKSNNIISDFKLDYDYLEDDNFVLKYQDEYDQHLNLKHNFSVKDIDQNIKPTITIYLNINL